MAGAGHNSGDDPYRITAGEISQFVERYEQLESEKKDISEQQKELMAEAKGRGYDTKIMREVVKRRRMTPDARAEHDTVLELYETAIVIEV